MMRWIFWLGVLAVIGLLAWLVRPEGGGWVCIAVLVSPAVAIALKELLGPPSPPAP